MENETTEVVNEVVTETAPETVEPVAEENAKRPRAGRTEFLTAWEETVAGLKGGTLTGSGVKIVADKLGLQLTTVQQRATKYRRAYGIPLSNMPRTGGPKFNANDAKAELEAIKAKLSETKTEG